MSLWEERGALLRFVLIGFSNAGIGFGVYWLGLHLPWRVTYQATVSQLVAYSIGVFWSFYWNRRWTFRSSAAVGRQALKFILLQASCALSSAGALGVLVDRLLFDATWSWLVVMTIITLINFLLSRFWVFGTRS